MRKIDEVWNEIKPILEKHFQDDSTKKEERLIPTSAEVSISCDGYITTTLNIDKRTVEENLGKTILLEPKIACATPKKEDLKARIAYIRFPGCTGDPGSFSPIPRLGFIEMIEKFPNTIQVSREQLAKAWDELYRIANDFAPSSKSETFSELCKALGFNE